MVRSFNMIWIATTAMKASSYYFAAADGERSNKDESDISITTRGSIDMIDSDGIDLPSQRRLQQDGLGWLFQSLPLVSNTCRNGMEVLYQSSELQTAYNAFAAAEQIAFQRSCDDVPRDGLTPNYECDVKIDPPTVIDNFERACVAAGGNVQDFGGGTTIGIECCGEAANGNFLTYGYRTLDQRSCVAAAECTADEASRFYQQGMFRAGTQVFQDDLGLVCGMGCECGCIGGCPDQCPPDHCAPETAEYDESLELEITKSIYYNAIADAVVICIQEHQIDPTNFDCGEITVDLAKVGQYTQACSDVGGLLAPSEPVAIDCSSTDDSGYTIRITFEGTLTCVSPVCDLDAIGTKDMIAENTKESPALAFFDNIDTSICYDTIITDAVSSCHGYITGRESYIPEAPPQPIPCGTSQFGDALFPSFADLSCCSGDGRYFVWTGQTGGFLPYPLTEPACYAFAEALSMVLCDPRQGDFIDTKNVLRICRSSCDMVFDACGLPGANFPEWAGFNDGTSLCYDLFGGFESSSPCDGRNKGYVCKSGLTIAVVSDDQNCLDIVVPTNYDGYGQSPDACVDDDEDDNEIFCYGCVVALAAVGALLACLLLCCFAFLSIRRRMLGGGIAETGKEAGTNGIVKTPAVAIETSPITDNGSDPFPIIHAVAFLEPILSSHDDDNPKFSDISDCMVPHVTDPPNKETVRNEIGFVLEE